VRGFRPIVEIMFGDFLTLCLDQLLQHAAKFRGMYNDRVRVPLLVRTPMGGKRGYGPTHSQSIEKFFVGIPGLQVVALNDRIPPGDVYQQLLQESDPSLVIENKVLYTRPLRRPGDSPFRIHVSDEDYPTLRLTMDDLRPDVTVFCYGEMLQTVEEAAIQAFREQEVITEIICPVRIHPLSVDPCANSVAQSRRLVTVEEGPTTAAVGSELTARLLEHGVPMSALRRLGNDGVVPCAIRAEVNTLPNRESVARTVCEVARQ